MDKLKVISGGMHPRLTGRICANLGVAPTRALVGYHSDGDDNVQILESLRGTDVFIVQPFGKPSSIWQKQLLVLIEATRRASATRVTAVIPYWGGARQDRKDKPRTPITARLDADLLVAAGVDRVLLLDVHAPQEEGFFPNRIGVDHVSAFPIIATHLKREGVRGVVFAGPDGNATKRFAIPYLGVCEESKLATIVKGRLSGTAVEKLFALGDVAHQHVILVDDMVTSAGTMINAILEFKEKGALSFDIISTDALFIGEAFAHLMSPLVQRVIVTNSLPTSVEGMRCLGAKATIVDVAPLLAAVIKNIHADQSVGSLLEVSSWAEAPVGVVSPEDNDSPSVPLWEALAPHLERIALGKAK